jgi:hypothetical protein
MNQLNLIRNYILSLWYRYKNWQYEQKCIKYFGARPTKIYLSQTDFDALQKRLAEPPKFNQNLYDLMNRKSPWDEDP